MKVPTSVNDVGAIESRPSTGEDVMTVTALLINGSITLMLYSRLPHSRPSAVSNVESGSGMLFCNVDPSSIE